MAAANVHQLSITGPMFDRCSPDVRSMCRAGNEPTESQK